ncbi:MAG: peptidoglycan DD-metalloendopeptidase family protein, partial [Flavobacteriales bacterium]
MYDSTTVESRPIDITQNANFGSSPVSGTPIITQNFHSAHPGLDIVGSGDILAVMDGVVQYVGPLYKSANSSPQCAKAGCLGGFSVVINHGGGTFTIYGNNSESYVQAGEQVRAGQ